MFGDTSESVSEVISSRFFIPDLIIITFKTITTMRKQFFIFMMALLPMAANADDSGICGYQQYDLNLCEYVMSDNVRWTYVESTHTLKI